MLKVYTLDQREEWDTVVHSFGKYDIYWLSGYVKGFQIHGDGMPLLFHFEEEGTRGIHVVMQRDVADDERFANLIPQGMYLDFVSPYGYGGWLIEGEGVEKLFSSYGAWLEAHSIVSEFVRFHPVIRNHEDCSSFYEISQMGEIVCMELASPNVIWEQITSKNRNMIRKAKKNGVRIFHGSFLKAYEVFKEIYDSTMDRDGANRYYYFGEEFYRSILEDLPYSAQVFWAEKDDMVIAASIILCANGYMNYHLSGSRKEYTIFAPTNLLLYEAACWGSANGYRTFYLGGGVGSGDDGLLRFKKSFNRNESGHFFIGRKIYDAGKYADLLAIRKMNTQEEMGFFPAYRG